MSLTVLILMALFLDALAGDPRWLPHPVRLMAWLAGRAEFFFRRIMAERAAGVCTVILVLAVTVLFGWVLIMAAGKLHPLAGDAVSLIVLFTCFAARDLLEHSRRVASALVKDDLVEAQKRVGMIVGRDTDRLDREGVVRACVESVAENTVDGVVAPVFWAVLAGPLGVLAYKAASTMDSLFGYTNERYLRFGWAAARLDDLFSWIPARIAGLMMVASSRLLGLRGQDAWRVFRRDRLRHKSPNSGHAEAAAAGALGIRLGGTASYGGKPVNKPFIGDDCFPPDTVHIAQVNRLMLATTVLAAMVLLGVRLTVVLFMH